MARAGRLSRRGLFGAGLVGAAALSGLSAQQARAGEDIGDTGPLAPGERPNVVVVVLGGMRADVVGAYDGDGHTPNLDRLADHALRFERAIPEGLPAVPVRRALLTGMRSYPFRDWRAVEGVPAIPGWSPIWPDQPLLPERVALDGLNTVVISDDPLLGGERFAPFLRRTTSVPALTGCDDAADPCGACLKCLGADTARVPGYLTPLAPGLRAATDPTQRVMTKAIATLDELRTRQPFVLVVDVFDPAAVAAPPVAFVDGDRTVSDIFTPGRLDEWRARARAGQRRHRRRGAPALPRPAAGQRRAAGAPARPPRRARPDPAHVRGGAQRRCGRAGRAGRVGPPAGRRHARALRGAVPDARPARAAGRRQQRLPGLHPRRRADRAQPAGPRAPGAHGGRGPDRAAGRRGPARRARSSPRWSARP